MKCCNHPFELERRAPPHLNPHAEIVNCIPQGCTKTVSCGFSRKRACGLAASGEAGVKHFFVEQDQTPGDPLDSLKKSIEYLRTVEV